VVVNPNFKDFTNFVPASRLNYGINLGTAWQTGLSTTASWVLGNTRALPIVATDAPLLPHQLKRLARRVPMEIGRMGGYAGNSSGDIFIAFSTANPGAANREVDQNLLMIPNENMSPLFEATVQATEESILNALVAAKDMTGKNNTKIYALPKDRLIEILKKYNRIK